MLFPRRVRRRLLLPPGWVALGFFLLLSCWTLLSSGRQLRLDSVMQITLPALKVKDKECEICRQNTLRGFRQVLSQVSFWHTITFSGRASDSIVAKRVPEALDALERSLQQRRGLAIRLAPGTRYNYLIYVLDLLHQHDTKRYVLDFYSQPNVLYIVSPHFMIRQPASRNLLPPVQTIIL